MRNLRNLLTATALTVAVFVQAQQLVPVGRGSYASYTPLANCRSTQIELQAGECQIVSFEITSEDLKFYNHELEYVCEPGEFEVMIGPNSRDVKSASFVYN